MYGTAYKLSHVETITILDKNEGPHAGPFKRVYFVRTSMPLQQKRSPARLLAVLHRRR